MVRVAASFVIVLVLVGGLLLDREDPAFDFMTRFTVHAVSRTVTLGVTVLGTVASVMADGVCVLATATAGTSDSRPCLSRWDGEPHRPVARS